MPLVVEISVAFSVLVAFIVIACSCSASAKRFDSVELEALTSFARAAVNNFTHPTFYRATNGGVVHSRGDCGGAGAAAQLLGGGSPQRAGHLRHSDRSGLAPVRSASGR